MEFPLRIVDESRLLSDLDLFQIERIVWLRLASVEHRVRSVKLKVSIEIDSPDHLFAIELHTKLDSGHTVVTYSKKRTVGAVVLGSAARMARQVSRRIKYESSLLYRFANSLKMPARVWCPASTVATSGKS